MNAIRENPAMVRTGEDILSFNLERVGAVRVPPRAFPLLSAVRSLAFALGRRDFDVGNFHLAKKSVLPRGQSCGARSGPRVDGSLNQYLDVPAPATRKLPPWEIRAPLETPS